VSANPIGRLLPTQRRRQQAAIALSAVAQLTTISMLATVMPVFIGRNASPFAVSLALVAFSMGLMVFAPVWGAVADVTGRRRAVLIGTTVLATLSLTPLLVFDSVLVQIGARGLHAAFFAGFAPILLAIVSERGGTSGRGRSVGFFNTARSVGGIAGRALSGVVLGLLAPPETYGVIAAASVLTTIAAVLISEPRATPDQSHSWSELLEEVKTRLLPTVENRDHFKTNGLGWLYIALVCRNMTVKGIGSVLPIYLVAEVGATELAMGLILTTSPIVRTAAMYGFGRVTDRIGRKPLVVAGILGGSVQALVLFGAHLPAVPAFRLGVAGVGMVVHALAYSALTTGAIAFIGDISETLENDGATERRESELMGIRTTTRGLGGVLGPLLVGVIATLTGYTTAFLALSVLAFGGGLLVQRTMTESLSSEETRPILA